MAAATAAAISMVAPGARVAVAWVGAAATTLVALIAVEAARRGRVIAELRAKRAVEEKEFVRHLAQHETQVTHLAETLLPQMVERLKKGEFVEDLLNETEVHDGTVTPEFHAARQTALRTVLEAVNAEEGLRDSAQRAFVNLARRMQAIGNRQARDLRDMEDRHGNAPAVFDDLLRLDHGNALMGRLADSIAVLGGARPGRQWREPVPFFSVLRGAASRIADYNRVDVHPVSEVAVVGTAVEAVIHAVAELLDNGTRYSPPTTRVTLTAVEVQTGIAIEIEDGGLSLSEEARARAERMLQEAGAGIDLTDLGETPRLGLAVVGRLAQSYGFQVSLRPSAYGGVRAVLIVPQRLITTAPATGLAHGIGASSGPRASATPSSAAAHAAAGPQRSPVREDDGPQVSDRTSSGLPQRRRHSPGALSPTTPRAEVAPKAAEAASETVQPGMWLAAFQGGVNGHSPDAAPTGRASDESSGKDQQ